MFREVTFADIFIFMIGLIVGSFLNVCIHRLPRGESVVKPRSHCPKCKQLIRWFDNVPLVSFMVLGGRCRACHTRIAFRYPIVEFVSGLIWVGSWRIYGFPFFWVPVAFLSLLWVMGLTDWETGLIPDKVSLSGLGLGIVASFFYPNLHQATSGLMAVGKSLLGALVGAALLYMTALIGNWIFQRESMGGGDVKLLAMVGSFLGWEKVLFTFFTAPLLALPFALYQRWVKREEIIPYGPFLSAAAAVQFFYGHLFWRYFLIL